MASEASDEFVRRARATLDLTQREFGARLGVGKQTIIRYEGGGPLPETSRLAILRLLDEHKAQRRSKRK